MGIFDKVKNFVGLTDQQEYDYEYDEVGSSNDYPEVYQEQASAVVVDEDESQPRRSRDRLIPTSPRGNTESMSNVIGMPGASNGASQVILMEPRSFEEMPQAIQALRERKSVVLNLTMMEPDQAQRAVDFVAGGTYAIDGHQERIGDSIFLFAPSCVQVVTQGTVAEQVVVAPPARVARPTTPAPAWSTEAPMTRFAQ
jgi:cell division inhibitor SepF